MNKTVILVDRRGARAGRQLDRRGDRVDRRLDSRN